MQIQSVLYSLRDIVEQSQQWSFRIPIYQRLYVWGETQVLTLLEDLCNAHARETDIFFLGGTMLVEQDGPPGRRFDLVDGQQRFTTLWLLAHAWGNALEPFLRTGDGALRLQFAIRPDVNQFLEDLSLPTSDEDIDQLEEEDSKRRMQIALSMMESIFGRIAERRKEQDLEGYRAELADYVFNRVRFVITTVPQKTDLNKLFEVINNRGVQLQHHEILKARMLDMLDDGERDGYASLWNACAGMEDFIEDSLCGVTSLSKNEATTLYTSGKLADPDAVRHVLQNPAARSPSMRSRTLQEIFAASPSNQGEPSKQGTPTSPTGVRSILGFPLFLQHVLRIWLWEKSREGVPRDLPRLLDLDLLALFESHFFSDESEVEDVRSFLDLLWRLRVLFDLHFIKWIDQGEETVHLIGSISVSTDARNSARYMSRSRETDSSRELSLLQSMLYHSQEITTQYWITPLLLYIHRNSAIDQSEIFQYLRHLDNHLLGTASDEPLIVRTHAFMCTPWKRGTPVHADALIQGSGTKFAHYWFYKLEFVLWYLKQRTEPTWNSFRITAKNSVEHISPQTPQEWDEDRASAALHHFGNLALVSRRINSEFGNLPYKEKRQRFLGRNRARPDSLKMDLIYRHETWSDALAFQHQSEMIDCINLYCSEPLGTEVQ